MRLSSLFTAIGICAVLAAGGHEARSAGPKSQPVDVRRYVFDNGAGRRAEFSLPVLERFSYPGDAALCARLTELIPDEPRTAKEVLLRPCPKLATLPAVEKSAALIKLADWVVGYSRPSNTKAAVRPDEDLTLALSTLKQALDILPSDATEAADAVLEDGKIASYASETFPAYDPPFLFKDVMSVETGEARVALCPLIPGKDCKGYTPDGLIPAMIRVGRWRSDEKILVRAADLVEQQFRNLKPPADFAEGIVRRDMFREPIYVSRFGRALGYAGESTADQASAIGYYRRSLVWIEDWLRRSEGQADNDALIDMFGLAGAQYGRLSTLTRTRDDAAKALSFDRRAYEAALKSSDEDDRWAPLSNMGDSELFLAELNGDETGFREALQHHREALALANKGGRQNDILYSQMKLARTQLHVVQGNVALSPEEKRRMLEDGLATTQKIIPVFTRIGARTYLDLTRNIATDIQRELDKLRRNGSEAKP